MIKQLFETMNDVLDDIALHYPNAEPAQKHELSQKLNALKSMSDHMIEEWLKFEEKMGSITQHVSLPTSQGEKKQSGLLTDPGEPGFKSDDFNKGQGYFQLMMFENAVRSFEQVVRQFPDFMLGRLYLAMGHMRNGNEAEAYRHFKFIISISDHAPMRAISYNAMGCIQAKNDNLEQAQQLFQLAYQADPSCVQPVHNMEVCAKQAGTNLPGQNFLH
jgi:tetratricopeptide (TPR) repeat protein